MANELQVYTTPCLVSLNHRAVNTCEKLALILYYSKDAELLNMTRKIFRVAPSTNGSVCVGSKPFSLVKITEEMRERVSRFEVKFGMTQVFGYIGGTGIPIKRLHENLQDLF